MINHSEFRPENILCPVDFSDLSSLAIKYAATAARIYGARLIVMHAGMFELPRYFSRSETDRLARELMKTKEMIQDDLYRHLKRVLGMGYEGIDLEIEVIDSDPGDAIMQTTEKRSVGLIVMGTHGLSGMKRIIIGSVTEGVIHSARIPVFTVRQKAHAFIDATDPEALPHIERIICASGITEDDRTTIDYAVSIAERFKAGLTVVYSDESHEEQDPSLVRERICAWVSGTVKRHCEIEPVIRRGNAADQIIAHAKEDKSDLIVMGARHRPFHDAVIIGRTTDLVVRYAPAPVLVVPGN